MSADLYIQTPIYENLDINARLGKRVYLKMECYQPVGSFKARGIGVRCREAVESGKTHLVSSSGGNAGYAAAYAGRVLGAQVTVVVPESTGELAKQRIASQGAEVIVKGAAWDDANTYALEFVKEVDGAFIHPFDDATVWAGHATMIDEAAKQCPKPDALVVSVGGGGLLSGLIQGMHRNGWEDVPVLAVETRGAESFAQSVAAGELVTLDVITSIATTLGARRVTPQTLEWARQHAIIPVVVSDRDAVTAALRFADDQRVIVEPACGASLSLLYDNAAHIADYASLLVIVCGGAGVSIGQLQHWRDTL